MTGFTTDDHAMWCVRLIFWRVLLGIVLAPIIGISFVHYESEGGGWQGIKQDLIANAKLVIVLATVGAVIGLTNAIIAIPKTRREQVAARNKAARH